MSETTEKLPEQAKASLDFVKLEITSDGTSAGTTILLNGKPITDLAYLNFSFWRCDKNSYCGPVSIGFTTSDPKATPGTLTQSSYYSLCAPADDDSAAAKQKRATATLLLRPDWEIPSAARPLPAFNRKLYADNFK